ncbi:MAG: hypothetical protein HYR90_01390 [Candidatus Andersenbacteria bacterium]|nr:hypothetical protein [Candidatus Andersenbacteria bacterium]MBI3250811.1 hypothetical protein [Candidatus Andersenbacteria bacterium]
MRTSHLILVILLVAGVLGAGFVLGRMNDGSGWQEYARKAYFEECMARIEEHKNSNGRQMGTSAVWLSDQLRECNTVAQERW